MTKSLLPLLACKNCNSKYTKSTSSLRLTYCGIFCEIADLGFSLDELINREYVWEDRPVKEEEKPYNYTPTSSIVKIDEEDDDDRLVTA